MLPGLMTAKNDVHTLKGEKKKLAFLNCFGGGGEDRGFDGEDSPLRMHPPVDETLSAFCYYDKLPANSNSVGVSHCIELHYLAVLHS